MTDDQIAFADGDERSETVELCRRRSFQHSSLKHEHWQKKREMEGIWGWNWIFCRSGVWAKSEESDEAESDEAKSDEAKLCPKIGCFSGVSEFGGENWF